MTKVFFSVVLPLLLSGLAIAQDAKEIVKIDHFTSTENLNNASNRYSEDLITAHNQQIADLAKNGVVIVRNDTTISTDKAIKVCFAWPVSNGQSASRSNMVRQPKVLTLQPAKSPNGSDAVQKWQIAYKDGSVKAIQ
ncbi:MAG: hypothetical protein KDC45_02455 [Bacteroidetes bacterium]|nr:hypothetical protein [Bacteroidota bacterium]